MAQLSFVRLISSTIICCAIFFVPHSLPPRVGPPPGLGALGEPPEDLYVIGSLARPAMRTPRRAHGVPSVTLSTRKSRKMLRNLVRSLITCRTMCKDGHFVTSSSR